MRRELHRIRRRRADDGFTILELLVVIALGGCLMAFAVFTAGNSLTAFKASSAMDSLKTKIQVARETAISRQRDVQIAFIGTNTVRFFIVNPDLSFTQFDEIVMEGNTTFTTFFGQGTPPENVCTPGPANPFANLNGQANLRFNSDGALINSATRNIIAGGCLYLGRPNTPTTARAISVFGTTGRTRTYRYVNAAWIH